MAIEKSQKIGSIPSTNYVGQTIDELRDSSKKDKLGLLGNLVLAKAESDQLLRDEQEFKEPSTVTPSQQKECEGVRDAIIKFLTDPKLYWTVSKLKASLEIEKFETSGPVGLKSDNVVVKGPVVSGGSSPGGMLPGAIGQGTVTEKLVMSKTGGKHGSQLKSYGHAYIGEGDITENSDTKEVKNEFTAVNLYFDKIDKGLIK
tara:strand:- start:473 stop:1078 length:606 start_codon:yes stop_codon:yes gene_type:complete